MALNPMAVLQRGYAVVTKNKQVVASRSQVQEGDALRVRLREPDLDLRRERETLHTDKPTMRACRPVVLQR